VTSLQAEEHFETLREPVWARFRARNPRITRDAFEDLWQDFWTREVERALAGRPSQAAAPVAFLAEALQRIVIDDLRARARGVARSEKSGLQFTDLEDQTHLGARDDTAADGRYVAVVHRVLDLVRGRLTDRELKVYGPSVRRVVTLRRAAR